MCDSMTIQQVMERCDETKARLDDIGIGVLDIEILRLKRHIEVADFAAFLSMTRNPSSMSPSGSLDTRAISHFIGGRCSWSMAMR
jgi:hypothetical protein